MSNVLEVNVLTGETIERDFTPEELTQRETDAAAALQARVDADDAVAARVALRASAESKLNKLGLSVEEITAVLTP
jgi:hypothetical protein